MSILDLAIVLLQDLWRATLPAAAFKSWLSLAATLYTASSIQLRRLWTRAGQAEVPPLALEQAAKIGLKADFHSSVALIALTAAGVSLSSGLVKWETNFPTKEMQEEKSRHTSRVWSPEFLDHSC